MKPVPASVGLSLGLLFGMFVGYEDKYVVYRNSPLDQWARFEDAHKIVMSLAIFSVFIWFVSSWKITRKPGELFVLSVFAGMVSIYLVWVLLEALLVPGQFHL